MLTGSVSVCLCRFGGDQPVYINIIRDPVNRFLSNYFFRRFGDWRGEQNHMIRTPSMRQEERYLVSPAASEGGRSPALLPACRVPRAPPRSPVWRRFFLGEGVFASDKLFQVAQILMNIFKGLFSPCFSWFVFRVSTEVPGRRGIF